MAKTRRIILFAFAVILVMLCLAYFGPPNALEYAIASTLALTSYAAFIPADAGQPRNLREV